MLDYYDLGVNHFFFECDFKKKNKQYSSKPKKIIKKSFKFFKIENDAVIEQTYFPFIYEKMLQLLYFHSPSFYVNDELKESEIYNNLRGKISINADKKKNVENFIRENIYNYLPTTIIEQFSYIISNCEKIYPKNPKFILTSLSQENDENFKFYTALKVEQKTPYFILQHGNTYIVEDFVQNRVEFETPNSFFSFGIANKNKVIKSFCNHLTLRKKLNIIKMDFYIYYLHQLLLEYLLMIELLS